MKELIKITGRLRLDELQNVAVSTLEIIEPFDALASNKQEITDKLALFIDGMEKTKTTQDRKTLDRKRDNRLTGLGFQIKASNVICRDQGDDSLIPQLDRLMEIYTAHAIGITKLHYAQETSAVENYISELRTLDEAFLTQTNIASWIPYVEAANEEFKNVSMEKINVLNEEDKTIAASKIAENLIDSLNKLYTVMFAQLVMSPSPELNDAYGKIDIMLELI